MKSRKKNKKKNKSDGGGDGIEGDARGAAAPEASSVAKTEYSQKAEEEFARGDWNAAINSYNRAIALANQKPKLVAQLLLGRAKARWYAKDFAQAITDATAAASMEPTGAAHLWRANGHLRLDQFQDALEHYGIALRLYGDQHSASAGVKEAMRYAAECKLQPSKEAKKVLDVEWFRSKGLLDEEVPKTSEDLPLLNPVGEYTVLDSSAADLADPSKRSERAVREKELGNNDFAAGMYISALVHYSNAIKLQPREPVFYSNRALVYLKLNRFAEAITDCTASIDRKPSIKAFARRAAAWASLHQHVLAADDYKRALKFEARNQDCLQELQKCLAAIEEDCQKQLTDQPQNDATRRLLKRVREDYKKYIVQAALDAPPANSTPASSATTAASPVTSSVPTTTTTGAAHPASAAASAPATAPASSAQQPASAASPAAAGTGSIPPVTAQSPVKNVHAERELLDEIIEFSKRLEADHTDSQAFLGRARLYLKRNDLDKAIADFKLGLRIDPDNKELQQGLRQAISIKTKDLQDRQARDSATQAAALAQPTTITGQTSLMFESEPATDAIPAEAPVSATHPPMLVTVGGTERPEAPRAPAPGATNGNVVNSSGFVAPSALSSAKQHAAAAAANNTPADLPDLSEDSAEYDEEEEDYDLESDPESDDSSPPKPVPPGHKQP